MVLDGWDGLSAASNGEQVSAIHNLDFLLLSLMRDLPAQARIFVLCFPIRPLFVEQEERTCVEGSA